MTYLLDTHTLIWFLMDKTRLSKVVSELLEDTKNQILCSAVSFWELAIKISAGKLELNADLELLIGVCQLQGIHIVSLDAPLAAAVQKLTVYYHRDPFDRMLIQQAIELDVPLLSKDKTIQLYQSEGLKTIW